MQLSLRPFFLQYYVRDDFINNISHINSVIVATATVGPRFLFAFVFFGLFLLQGLIRGPISLVWARLVENEKPVFTLFFGGTAAIAKAADELASHLS